MTFAVCKTRIVLENKLCQCRRVLMMTTLAIVEVLAAVVFFTVLGVCSYMMKHGEKKEVLRNREDVVCEN